MKLLKISNKDKRYVSNWRPILLINFDLKIISKSWASRLKNVLGKLIDARQTAYVNERFIGESSCLIDDVLKVCDMQKLSVYLLTVDFEKAFDSLTLYGPRRGADLAPPVRFFSVPPEVVMEGLWNLVTFPKIYLRRFSKKIFLVTMDCVAMATKLSEGSQDKKSIYFF